MEKEVSDDKIIMMKIKGLEEIMTHLSWEYPTDGASVGDHPKPR